MINPPTASPPRPWLNENGLTVRQQEALNTIARYIADHGGRSPTFREISDLLGARSTSQADHFLRVLERAGCLTRGAWGTARTIQLTGKALEKPAMCPTCGRALPVCRPAGAAAAAVMLGAEPDDEA